MSEVSVWLDICLGRVLGKQSGEWNTLSGVRLARVQTSGRPFIPTTVLRVLSRTITGGCDSLPTNAYLRGVSKYLTSNCAYI